MPVTIVHKTPTREVEIEYLTAFINRKIISVQKEKFNNLCKSCRCFNNKYSCPPYSPCFSKISRNSENVQVICFKIPLRQFKPTSSYHALRAANSVIKGLLDRKLLELRSDGFDVVGSGSCRACKPCNAVQGLPCKRPDRKLTSLESMGVDVNRLVHDCFDFDLQWLNKIVIPEFTCAVGAVLL